MRYSDMVDILRDEMHKKDLADKEVEFCTKNRLGLKLLSVDENNEDGVYIDIGTNEDSEERNNEITKAQTPEKIILGWGRAGMKKPPNQKEIEDTLIELKKKSSKSNVFHCRLSGGMVEYLKNRLDPNNAVMYIVTGPYRPNSHYWVIIGADKETVSAELSIF